MLIVFISLTVIYAKHINALETDCIQAENGFRYREEVICSELEKTRELAVNMDTLYFKYYDSKSQKHKSAKLDLRTKDYKVIEELSACYFTVNRRNHDVYAGCLDEDGSGRGLYKYDNDLEKFVQIGEENKVVGFVYYNDILYYSINPLWEVRTFLNEKTSRFKKLDTSYVRHLVIDKDNDIIFYNFTGLYLQKSGSTNVIFYPQRNVISGIAEDAAGNTYVCDYLMGDISIVNKSRNTLTKVVDVPDCRGLAFDGNNNMIYVNGKSNRVIRLLKCT